MRVEKITFSLARTMPLQPISKHPDDAYANVKPFASCTVIFDADEDTSITAKNLDAMRAIVQCAFEEAQRTAFGSIQDFSNDLRELYAKSKP